MESLYALAGMFPDNDKTENKGELAGESTESKPSALPEARESPAPALGPFLIYYGSLAEAFPFFPWLLCHLFCFVKL